MDQVASGFRALETNELDFVAGGWELPGMEGGGGEGGGGGTVTGGQTGTGVTVGGSLDTGSGTMNGSITLSPPTQSNSGWDITHWTFDLRDYNGNTLGLQWDSNVNTPYGQTDKWTGSFTSSSGDGSIKVTFEYDEAGNITAKVIVKIIF